IGQLPMRNLDNADSRQKLELYAGQGQLRGHAELDGSPEPGGAAAIKEIGRADDAETEAEVASLDDAAMEFGAD
ncbi:MAG: argininosuccinate synthase, partial [Candidatus Nanopelagicales bacterium]